MPQIPIPLGSSCPIWFLKTVIGAILELPGMPLGIERGPLCFENLKVGRGEDSLVTCRKF